MSIDRALAQSDPDIREAAALPPGSEADEDGETEPEGRFPILKIGFAVLFTGPADAFVD